MKIVVILFLAIAACNRNPNSRPGVDDGNSSSNIIKDNKSVITDFTKDSIFTVQFPKDSSSVTLTAKLNGISKPVTAIVPIKKGKQLTLSISTRDSVANIRINQIFTPDGRADGPFGRTVKRNINSPGNYKIIVGEDQMQGDEWKGKFTLTIKVE